MEEDRHFEAKAETEGKTYSDELRRGKARREDEGRIKSRQKDIDKERDRERKER